ncbi:hypothetical protein GCM10008096_18290 [Zhihengliuella salsuginis]|uniref:DUF4439 domain-containing protein n=1 Tax=Zhihengliuella salsuginis TaxID=578222 RepID=A0ABQ3GHQ9_9MICC|nr:hypothetical protein GCM10008096_18290 [Zhihengliuella salsuginis]
MAALAAAAETAGAGAPDDVVHALQAHPDLIGAPERVEPYFDWIPEVAPPPAVIEPAADLDGLAGQLEAAARATLQRAVTVEADPEARDAGAGTVPAERIRTLVAVGMEQVRALAELDPEAAAAVREDVLGDPEPSAEGPAVAAERCGAVSAAAGEAYRLAYLYEFGAVRRDTPRPQDAPDDAAARWWTNATERAALGDRLAGLLPDGCVALRESAYAVPADDDLAEAIRSAEARLALSLRDAAAAADPAARPALIERAFAAVHLAAEGGWFELAAVDAG